MTVATTGGRLLVDALLREGVRTVFGSPGVQLGEAADALYAASDRIAFVCVRNEQAATYLADGYARSSGGRYIASDLTNPDYRVLASAFGVGYVLAKGPDQLERVLHEVVPANEPVLVEMPAGEFPSPWHLIHEGIR